MELYRADSWWVFTGLQSIEFSTATKHPTLLWRPEAADTLQTTAIIVVCLASFRAFFTRESRRSQIPYEANNLHRLFPPAVNQNNGQITTVISASGNNETKFVSTSWDESSVFILSPDEVHVRYEFDQTFSASGIDIELGKIKSFEDHPRS